MTWEEIREQYAGQWVLIEYWELDEQLNVVHGEVVAHAPAKEEIYQTGSGYLIIPNLYGLGSSVFMPR